jgi:dCMP deaminase
MDTTEHFFNVVADCASHSNCVRQKVGAVLVRDRTIVSKGWNGVAGHTDCREAGCLWCTEDGPLGMGYDRCICTHAEQAAIGNAARNAIATADAVLYVSLRPCLNCVKLSLSCGIIAVVFETPWRYADELLEQLYGRLTQHFRQFSQSV